MPNIYRGPPHMPTWAHVHTRNTKMSIQPTWLGLQHVFYLLLSCQAGLLAWGLEGFTMTIAFWLFNPGSGAHPQPLLTPVCSVVTPEPWTLPEQNHFSTEWSSLSCGSLHSPSPILACLSLCLLAFNAWSRALYSMCISPFATRLYISQRQWLWALFMAPKYLKHLWELKTGLR